MTTTETITLNPSKKIYFASDFHLGVPDGRGEACLPPMREKRIVQWLDEISKDAQTVFLLGDVFDFWFEYKHVVPKGHVRLLGKLAEMADNGIDLRLFVGNHDLWTFGYLENEIGMKIYRQPQLFKINETLCLIGHGDGLGSGNNDYKFIKKVFEYKLNQRLFAFLHPWIGVSLANFFSKRSRVKTGEKDLFFETKEKESLYIFSKAYLEKNPNVKYFIFGHRHLPLEIKLTETSTYFNTGDWLKNDSYLEMCCQSERSEGPINAQILRFAQNDNKHQKDNPQK
ncbi:MAG: UDP-2,3-diacylglucosamine diphosphatase [Bacteroidales bacterium]|jgi:UDP-2,3-diacylglucosamine hydrolase|nr:UDP-2,3-diacylglucosamine diphosphatase [Bacteroidales bacterium]